MQSRRGACAQLGLILVLAACVPRAAPAIVIGPSSFRYFGRERVEELVAQADVVCDATLDHSRDGRVLLRDASVLKGPPLPRSFEVRVSGTSDSPRFGDRTPGTRYRLFLVRPRPGSRRQGGARSPVPWFAPLAIVDTRGGDAPLRLTQAAVDSIAARSTLAALFAAAELVVLAEVDSVVLRHRDGAPVLGACMRVRQTLKGTLAADTFSWQGPWSPGRQGRRNLLFLRRRDRSAWSEVWPGAGTFEFDTRNLERRSGRPLQDFLAPLGAPAHREPRR